MTDESEPGGTSAASDTGGGKGPAPSGDNATGSPGHQASRDDRVAWGIASTSESRIPATLAAAVAVVLQVALPDRVIVGLGPRWLVPAFEVALVVVLLLTSSGGVTQEYRRMRAISLAMIAMINLANAISLGELIYALLNGTKSGGRSLVYASAPIWLTNVIVFGLWYWEFDRGGPAQRLRENHRQPDFLFPQMSTPGVAPGWTPRFFDYLYTSFTNATAFSPTDTMPLSGWAKLIMMMQSLASLLTVALVVSRAVNILN